MSMNPNASSKAKRKRSTTSKVRLMNSPPSSQEYSTVSTNANGDLPNLNADILNMRQAIPPDENQSQNPGLATSGIDELEELKAKLTGKHATQRKNIYNALAGVGTGAVMFGAKGDGMVILKHTDSFSTNLALLGQENEQVYKVLEFLTSTSAWFTCLGELLVIIVELAAVHGVDVSTVFKRPQKQVA